LKKQKSPKRAKTAIAKDMAGKGGKMYRTSDTVIFSADQWGQIGKDMGFSKDILRKSLDNVFASSKLQISISDPSVQFIRNRLLERNLVVPKKFPAMPTNPDKNKFTRMVYVNPKIPLKQLISAIEVNGKKLSNYLDLKKVKDAVKTPNKPYFVWMQDGALYTNKSPNQAVSMFSSNERGATLREGLFLILYYPEILKHHYIDLPGSRYDRGDVPYLVDWGGDPQLRASSADNAFPRYGSASSGSIS